MDYLKVLKRLISIDTSVPPGNNYEEIIQYLEPLFRSVGLETYKVNIPIEHTDGHDGRFNLICHRRDTGKPRLIVYSHIDVVPAVGWSAFEPRVEGGRIYGRGAADMKGAIVALLLGLEAVNGRPLKYDITVMVTTDEELGQANQLRYLARHLEPLSGAYILNLDASFAYVGIASLGALQVEIRVNGRSVHSAMSHMGENAVEKASLIMQALLALKKHVEARKSSIDVHPNTGLNKMEARLNINMVQGGVKVNVLPDQCLISVDRRLIPEESLEEAKKELIGVLSSVPGVQWELDRIFTIPTVPACEDVVVDELVGIVKDIAGESGKYGEMGSGDLPAVAREWGAKVFNLGVIRPECNIHGRDEFVYQRDIEELAKIIARFLSAA